MSSELLHELSGIDLGRADEIAPLLSAEIAAGGDYRIVTSDWARCDLAGIAVLLSALVTAAQRGARLSVVMPSGGLVETRMRACGIDPARHLHFDGTCATGLPLEQSQGV
ncbi:STAS domain-containing protein [Rhodovulum strictum]|uniref:STAS domain-containing protein n=1 Tax=Rhodovulum strictum TaxID=58314 RepID=A0A844B7D8_9RHOB|nr:STAS domain-containing protein [Rhodovulum strictum]MRH20304.1 STAS domain-containing protein [Rhodovulum strictum]